MSKILICPFDWILHISQDLIFLSCDSVFLHIPQQRGNREEADDLRIYCNSQLTSRETGVFCCLREQLKKQGASLERSQKDILCVTNNAVKAATSKSTFSKPLYIKLV